MCKDVELMRVGGEGRAGKGFVLFLLLIVFRLGFFLPQGSPHELTCLLSEKCSGGCNIFHLLAFLDAPAEPVPAERRGAASRSSPRSMGLREMMRQASMLPSGE